jgi:hypothetical protein
MNELSIQKLNGKEMPEYQGISTLNIDEKKSSLLDIEVNPNDVEIRPDGLIYVPEIKFRRVLNKTFGPGSWSIFPRKIGVSNNILFFKGALFINGKFVSEAIGEQEYFESNPNMSFATASEAAKSNCLVRCCKDLGIYWQLWDPNFINDWIESNAIQVWVQHKKNGQAKTLWRKNKARPYNVFPWKETGPVLKAENVIPISNPHVSKSEESTQNKPGWFVDYLTEMKTIKESFSTIDAADEMLKIFSIFSMKDENDLRGGEKLQKALSRGVIKTLKEKLDSLQYAATSDGF